MADFTITVTNSLRVFGIEPPNVWGTVLWGENWGYGNVDLITKIAKLLSNTLVLSDTSAGEASFNMLLAMSLSVTEDLSSQELSDPSGYTYIFGVSENAENRPLTSYTNSSDPVTTSFTTLTNTLTAWVEP